MYYVNRVMLFKIIGKFHKSVSVLTLRNINVFTGRGCHFWGQAALRMYVDQSTHVAQGPEVSMPSAIQAHNLVCWMNCALNNWAMSRLPTLQA